MPIVGACSPPPSAAPPTVSPTYAHCWPGATPNRSGDALAGLAAESAEQRVAAQIALADLPLRRLLDDPVVPYETDEVTRLICDTHDADAFAPISHLTVGGPAGLAAVGCSNHGEPCRPQRRV